MECKSYIRVLTADEAVQAAAGRGENTLFVSGATDVAIKAREGQPYKNRDLIDIADVADLKTITESEHHLHIGGNCTHTQITEDPLILRYAQVLAKACETVGSPQIRNRGTIGGNIANASPAADSLPALAALHAVVIVKNPEGTREIPLAEVITGPYRTSLAPVDLITEIRIDKMPDGTRHHFTKIARRNALAISRLTVAAAAKTNERGEVDILRLAVGSVFPSPFVFEDLHKELLGSAPTEEKILSLAKALSDKIPEVAGVRPSTAYKQPVTCNVIVRALREVLEV